MRFIFGGGLEYCSALRINGAGISTISTIKKGSALGDIKESAIVLTSGEGSPVPNLAALRYFSQAAFRNFSRTQGSI
jgi:hypothetical protein